MSGKIENLLSQANIKEDESSISSAEKTFSGEAETARIFSRLKAKLLAIEEWNEHGALSSYKIFEENGQPFADKNLFVGAFIRISLKGSGKYDWVKVYDIFEAADEFVVTVKPTFDPTRENPDKTLISHFFTEDATNNFCLLKKSETIFFYVIGLNEKRNTTETENALETVRNLAVNLGSYLGIQNSEWEKFGSGFLECAAEELGAG
jgi:hypothetical protein